MPHNGGMAPELVVFLVCLGLSACFCAAETALLTANRLRFRGLAAQGDRVARRVLALASDPRRLLAGLLVGNNIAQNLAASSVTVYFVKELALGDSTGVAVATGVTTVALVLFGEYLPKTTAAAHPDAFARWLARPVQWALILLKPAVVPLQVLSRPLSAVFRAKREDLSLADLRVALAESMRQGSMDETLARVLRGGLSLAWKTVADALVPRVDVRAVDAAASYDACLEVFRRDKYSRLLVMDGTPDADLGYLSIKDMSQVPVDQRATWKARDLVRQALRVPMTLPLSKLLVRMRRSGAHFAVVKDEHGGTEGIVTLEDVLEELVGEIRDEHDVEESPPVREVAPNAWMVRGDVGVLEINDRLGLALDAERARTVGGLVAELLGRFPREGESVEATGARLVASRVTGRRVLEVRVERS